MLSTLEPWHRRDLGMAFQQPTNRPLGQLSVKRSQSLMPKDTDGDNELDPIDFYTCTLDLNHWKDWWREGIFGVTSMQQRLCLGSVLRPGERHAHPYGGGRSSAAATG